MSHTRESIPCDPLPYPEASLDPLESNLPRRLPGASPNSNDPESACSCDFPPGVTLSEVFRHSGWANDRARILAALKRTQSSVTRILRFLSCGTEVFVHRSFTDPPIYRLGGSYCHDRFCVPCANERARTIARNLRAALPRARIRFITLTIADRTPMLVSKLDKLQRSFVSLQRSRLWKERVTGGVAFLEIKRSSRSDTWNVHYHVLVTGKYIDQATLSHTWRNITGDAYIVDIRSAGSPESVSRYVTKYASKPIHANFLRCPGLLDEAIVALHRRRLCQTFGRLRGLKLTATDTDDGWEAIGSLDSFLRRERDGDAEAAEILAVLRTDRLDDARQWLVLHPDPPPPKRAPNVRTWPLFDAMLPTFV